MAKPTWQELTKTHSRLHLDCIAVDVVGINADTWNVRSSHGEPKGDYSSKETAQRYAEKFAASMIEKTLAALSNLESDYESPTNGWSSQPCVLVVMRIPPGPEFTDKDGAVIEEVFEKRRHDEITKTRTKLRATLADLGR